MQGGFALIEAGCVRSKNTTNILIKNLLDSCESYHFKFDLYSFIWSKKNTVQELLDDVL